MPFPEAAQSSDTATKEPRSNKGQSKDSATIRKDVEDGERKHAEMWRRIKEASMQDLHVQLAELSTRVAQVVSYLGSNEPQTKDNGRHSDTVAEVEATKGSKREVDPALIGGPGSVAGAKATVQNSGAVVQKEKIAATEKGP